MFYKHWKKLALTLTGFFWASCDFGSSTTEEAALYGCPPEGCEQNPAISSSNGANGNDVSSSSEAKAPESSSSEEFSSSSIEYEAIPLYGVRENVYTCIQKNGDSTLTCGDGVTCKEENKLVNQGLECIEDICPDYGIIAINEKTYTCDDGNTYNEAEFRTRYETITKVEEQQDTTFKQVPVLYGPPCVFNGTCNDEKE